MADERIPIRILLVEDNEADIVLIKETLKLNKVDVILDTAMDGVEALTFLYNTSGSDKMPDLILLDLNLPEKDGLEVLSEIKSDPLLRKLPVVILTSSTSEADIIRSYDLHANAYIQKPVGIEQLSEIVQSIENFWFTVVKLPPK